MSNALLARLCIVYGQPDSHDPASYLAEVAKMLAKYSPSELDRAADLILRTHRGRTFPTPAQIVTACEDARPPAPPVETKADPAWSKQAIAMANRLTESEMGFRAAQEGWIIGLHDYCRQHGKLPGPVQIAGIRKEAEFVSHCASGDVDLGVCHRGLVKLARAFVEKRAVHAERIKRAFSTPREAAE